MASVTFKRGTRAEIEATAKQDGQILMETDQNKKNKMYIDLPDGRRVLIGNSGEAIDTSYDNSTSGLDATNVQNAIDKIENNVGDISGITDSLTATSSNIALSAAGGNNLQGQINTLNSSLTEKTLPETATNVKALVVFATNTDGNQCYSSSIPLPFANQKTITLKQIYTPWFDPDDVSNFTILKNMLGFSLCANNSTMALKYAGKSAEIIFDYN